MIIICQHNCRRIAKKIYFIGYYLRQLSHSAIERIHSYSAIGVQSMNVLAATLNSFVSPVREEGKLEEFIIARSSCIKTDWLTQ